MKKLNRRHFLQKASLSVAALATSNFASAQNETKKRTPHTSFPQKTSVETTIKDNSFTTHLTDNGEALVNPMMGWTMHFYSNILTNYGSKLEPSDTLEDFPGLTTVYLRVPWAFVEPVEGQYVWELLDTPAQRWIEKGKYVAFRISAMESWLYYATPKWVFDAGAIGYDVEGKYYEPEYNDKIFIEKVDNFIKAFAARYDNNPNVAFVDVGHFGMWGEGHTVMTSPIHGHVWGVETQKLHIDLYLKHFRNTQLCISDDYVGHDKPGKRFEITDYAFSKGVTLRDDSILVQPPPRSWYHSELAQQFWPTLPVILEHEHYGSSVERGSWSKELLMKAIEDYHASFMSIHWWPRILLEKNRDVIDRINRRMGYRLCAEYVEWPQNIKKGELFTITSKWYNAGVAPCYKGGVPCYTLKDQKGGIVSTLVADNFDVKDLQVGEPGKPMKKIQKQQFCIAPQYKDKLGAFFRSCPTGEFDIYLSVGKRDGTPIYELPYYDTDGHKRYKIGKIRINE